MMGHPLQAESPSRMSVKPRYPGLAPRTRSQLIPRWSTVPDRGTLRSGGWRGAQATVHATMRKRHRAILVTNAHMKGTATDEPLTAEES